MNNMYGIKLYLMIVLCNPFRVFGIKEGDSFTQGGASLTLG